jgi:hypothetical protein
MGRKSHLDLFVREEVLEGVRASVRRHLRERGAIFEERAEHGRTYFFVAGQIEVVVGVWPAEHRPGVVIEARHADKKKPWTAA